MDDLKKACKQQASLRGSVTRYCNLIKGELESTAVCEESLSDHIAQLEAKEPKLDEINKRILDLLTDDDEFDQELSEIEKWNEKLVQGISRAKRWIKGSKEKRNQPSAPPSTSGSLTNISTAGSQGVQPGATTTIATGSQGNQQQSTSSSSTGNQGTQHLQNSSSVGMKSVRLAKLEIKPFDGTIAKWQDFWSVFENAIHLKEDYTKTDKLTYLKSYLRGQAETAIEGLALTDSNYEEAVSILLKRFGRNDLLVSARLNNFLKMKPVEKATDLVGLRKLHDTCQIEVRSLESLGHLSSNYGELLAHIVGGILPIELIQEFSRGKDENDLWKIDEMMEFLRIEIECRERAAAIHRSSNPQQTKQSSHNNSDHHDKNYKHKSNFSKSPYPSGAALNLAVNSGNFQSVCLFCEKSGHPYYQCNDVSVTEKRGIVIQKKLCFLCLRFGHQALQCRGKIQKCRKCTRKHHQILCDSVSESPQNNKGSEINSGNSATTATLTTSSQKTGSNVILLQTAQAEISDKKGQKTKVRVLLDGGSHRCFIKEKLSRALNLEVINSEPLEIYPFGSAPIKTVRRKVKVTLINVKNGAKVEIQALETPEICGAEFAVPDVGVRREMKERNLELSEDSQRGDLVGGYPIDVLIGADYFWKVALTRTERLGNALVALDTVLGWTVQGRIGEPESREEIGANAVAVMHTSVRLENDLVSNQLRSFWELESLGIDDPTQTKLVERECTLRNFENNIEFKGGRYEVGLPWKANKCELMDNFEVAKRRTLNLVGKLKSNPKKFIAYNEVIKEQIKGGIVELVKENEGMETKNPIYYIPHRGVEKSDRQTTKLRIVYDASSHSKNSPALNECLETGPNLMPKLFKILVRFRRGRIAYTGDIKQAFLQIGIKEEDRDALRFLWVEGLTGKQSEKLISYRITRVPFGCTASPFLLAATINYHLEKFKESHPIAYRVLSEALYVDDNIENADSIEEADAAITESTDVLERAGMQLRKWRSNSKELREKWSDKIENRQGELYTPNPDPLKVLGLIWDEMEDVLTYDASELLEFLVNKDNTKRWILKAVARIFDPLGLLSPYTIRGKIMLQETWQKGIDWDEQLEIDLSNKFENWCMELPDLDKIKISRYYFNNEPNDIKPQVEFNCFTDASEHAFAAVVYLRSEYSNGHVTTALVASKTRVAPVNKLTIPKLELMGAILGARLIKTITESLEYDNSSIRMWTDSTIVLHWIRSSASRWKPFVSNRIREIQNLTDPSCWSHVAGKDNPADLPTRGKTVQELGESSLWWRGPAWLLNKRESETDIGILELDEPDIKSEIRAKFESSLVAGAISEVFKPILNIQNYSSSLALYRITSWCFRYVNNLKSKIKLKTSCKGPLTAEEIINAEKYWIRTAQLESYPNEVNALNSNDNIPKTSNISTLSPFFDKDGLMCVGGRIEAAKNTCSYRERHPWILCAKNKLAELIVDTCHIRLKHSGIDETLVEVREQFWIPKIRPLIKREVSNCPRCKRFKAKASVAVMAPLPEARITPTPPFSVCGIDFAGPLYTRDGKKCYIALYTCAVTRAIHLEVVSDLSTDKFLLSFRRFIARRGIVNVIYSDNAMTFKRADADLRILLDHLRHPEVADYFGGLKISWRYIADRAAWWGGFWERMVRSVKTPLKKTLGQAHLTYEELETLLIEIEATVNSRPISFIYQDANEPTPLTPAHFLIGKRLTALPSRTFSRNEVLASSREVLQKRVQYRQTLLDRFWLRWKKNYLLELRSAHHRPNCKPTEELKVNDVVLIEENKIPRLMWKTAVVIETMKGRDNVLRSCVVRLPNGTRLRRPIQLLYHLEI